MSNLGLHRVLELIALHPDWSPLRAFLPPQPRGGQRRRRGGELRTFDRDVPLHRVQVVAFTISYEEDYTNVWSMLERGGFPTLARERGPDHPLVIAGGFAPTVNPEPIAALVDCFLLGPAEDVLSPFLDRWAGHLRSAGRATLADRSALPDLLDGLDGCYIPGEAPPAGRISVPRHRPRWSGDPAPQHLREDRTPLAHGPPRTRILTPHTEFADRFLVAVGRGCPQGCRFCVASHAARPPSAF